MRGEGVLAVHDHGQRLAVVGLLERGGAAHQHVQDHAEGPDVWKKRTSVLTKTWRLVLLSFYIGPFLDSLLF